MGGGCEGRAGRSRSHNPPSAEPAIHGGTAPPSDLASFRLRNWGGGRATKQQQQRTQGVGGQAPPRGQCVPSIVAHARTNSRRGGCKFGEISALGGVGTVGWGGVGPVGWGGPVGGPDASARFLCACHALGTGSGTVTSNRCVLATTSLLPPQHVSVPTCIGGAWCSSACLGVCTPSALPALLPTM
jgi:hypothetical protein